MFQGLRKALSGIRDSGRRLHVARERAKVRLELMEEVRRHRDTGDAAGLARALCNLGALERRRRAAHLARTHYQEAAAIYREIREPLALAHTARHLGDVHFETGRVGLAESCFTEALSLYRRLGRDHPLDHANALRSMAILRGDAGDHFEASLLWEQALTLYCQAGVDAGEAECRKRLARTRRLAGAV